jgi:hypothetical protein
MTCGFRRCCGSCRLSFSPFSRDSNGTDDGKSLWPASKRANDSHDLRMRLVVVSVIVVVTGFFADIHTLSTTITTTTFVEAAVFGLRVRSWGYSIEFNFASVLPAC